MKIDHQVRNENHFVRLSYRTACHSSYSFLKNKNVSFRKLKLTVGTALFWEFVALIDIETVVLGFVWLVAVDTVAPVPPDKVLTGTTALHCHCTLVFVAARNEILQTLTAEIRSRIQETFSFLLFGNRC